MKFLFLVLLLLLSCGSVNDPEVKKFTDSDRYPYVEGMYYDSVKAGPWYAPTKDTETYEVFYRYPDSAVFYKIVGNEDTLKSITRIRLLIQFKDDTTCTGSYHGSRSICDTAMRFTWVMGGGMLYYVIALHSQTDSTLNMILFENLGRTYLESIYSITYTTYTRKPPFTIRQ